MDGSAIDKFMRICERLRPVLRDRILGERRLGSTSRWRPALRVAAAWRDVLLGDGDGGPSTGRARLGSMPRDDMVLGLVSVVSGAVVAVVVAVAVEGGESELRSGAISDTNKEAECGFRLQRLPDRIGNGRTAHSAGGGQLCVTAENQRGNFR